MRPVDRAHSGGRADRVRVPARAAALARFTGVSAGLIVIGSVLYLTRGAPTVDLATVMDAIVDPTSVPHPSGLLIHDIRVPRLLMALLAGAGLGLVGAILQAAFRNPIADPSLLGVAEAISLVVALSLMFPRVLPDIAVPVLSVAAGFAAGGVLVAIAGNVRNPLRLLLVGVMLSSLIGTLTTVVVVAAGRNSDLGTLARFTTGSLITVTWENVRLAVPWLALAAAACVLCARPMNLLQLGDEVAAGLGMRVTRTRLALFLVAMLLVAPITAVTGPILFVALLSPHVVRGVLRTTNAFVVLPASALVGACVVLIADSLGRLLLFPLEVPAGIWTILLLGPWVVWLAGRSRRSIAAPARATS